MEKSKSQQKVVTFVQVEKPQENSVSEPLETNRSLVEVHDIIIYDVEESSKIASIDCNVDPDENYLEINHSKDLEGDNSARSHQINSQRLPDNLEPHNTLPSIHIKSERNATIKERLVSFLH